MDIERYPMRLFSELCHWVETTTDTSSSPEPDWLSGDIELDFDFGQITEPGFDGPDGLYWPDDLDGPDGLGGLGAQFAGIDLGAKTTDESVMLYKVGEEGAELHYNAENGWAVYDNRCVDKDRVMIRFRVTFSRTGPITDPGQALSQLLSDVLNPLYARRAGFAAANVYDKAPTPELRELVEGLRENDDDGTYVTTDGEVRGYSIKGGQAFELVYDGRRYPFLMHHDGLAAAVDNPVFPYLSAPDPLIGDGRLGYDQLGPNRYIHSWFNHERYDIIPTTEPRNELTTLIRFVENEEQGVYTVEVLPDIRSHHRRFSSFMSADAYRKAILLPNHKLVAYLGLDYRLNLTDDIYDAEIETMLANIENMQYDHSDNGTVWIGDQYAIKHVQDQGYTVFDSQGSQIMPRQLVIPTTPASDISKKVGDIFEELRHTRDDPHELLEALYILMPIHRIIGAINQNYWVDSSQGDLFVAPGGTKSYTLRGRR